MRNRSRDGIDENSSGAVPDQPRQLVAGLVLLILAFFTIQQLVIEKVGEPFPGLVLPSFAGQLGSDVVTRRTADLRVEFGDGETRGVGTRAFVAGASGRPFDLLNTMFWRNTEQVEGRRYVPQSPRSLRFTRDRLRELFPDRTARHMTVTWTREATNLDGTPNEEETQVVRMVDVDL